MLVPALSQLPALARQSGAATKKFFQRLKKSPPKDLDGRVHELHEEVFSEINCLDCANCCKTISPIFKNKDIDRIAKRLHLKPSLFVEKYLHRDEEGDHVLNSVPCPFLAEDNSCIVYEDRPEACRSYPHTQEKKFIRLASITMKNTGVCPAAYRIVERLKKEF